jgi:hypothetical protein
MLVGIGPEISESIKDIYTAAKVCASERVFLSSHNIPLGPNPMAGGRRYTRSEGRQDRHS